jgi:cyclic pyranopterin phosphate synthase
VREQLDVDRALSTTSWAELEPLERWAFVKVAESKRPERVRLVFDEIVGSHQGLTHLNESGEAHMVATSNKPLTLRRAVAKSQITMSGEAYRALIEGNAPKGDVLSVARIAGIMAAKQTAQLIPLCHPIHLTAVDVCLEPSAEEPRVDVRTEVTAVDRTGVEMEAMVAASVAALTVYDMLKAVDRKMVVGPTVLIEKSGGKSGEFRR